MSERSYGRILVEEFVRAIPWAIVFSTAMLITAGFLMGMVRQEVKEAMEYGPSAAIRQTIHAVLNDPAFNQDLLPKVKQNMKEAIDYTIAMADRRFIHEHQRSEASVKK